MAAFLIVIANLFLAFVLALFVSPAGALIAIVLGLIVAGIASAKNRSADLWFMYGTWLFPIALVHVVLARRYA